MAEYKEGDVVKLPDGTHQQLMNFGGQLKWLPVEYKADPTIMERLGRGMMDVGQGLKQGYLWAFGDDKEFKDYTAEVDKEVQRYDRDRALAGQDGIDWARIGGQVAATAPVGMGKAALTLPGQIAKSAGQGALAAGSIYTEGGDITDKALQVGMGMAGGGVAPVVANTVAKTGGAIGRGTMNIVNRGRSVAGNVANKVSKVLDDAGIQVDKPTYNKLVQLAKDEVKYTGKIDAESLIRKAEAESLGFVDDTALTAGQVTRNPLQWGREQNYAKREVGQKLAERFANQTKKMEGIGDDLMTKTGAAPKSISEVNESISMALRNKWNATQDDVTRAYNEAIKKHGDSAGSSLDGLIDHLDSIDWDARLADTVQSARNLLVKQGVLQRVTTDAGETIYEPTGKKLSLRAIEQVRKKLGDFRNSREPEIARGARKIIEAIDDDATASVGDSAFTQARNLAYKRFRDFESKIGNTLQKVTKDTLSEDDAYKSVLKAKTEELQAIKDNLLGKNLTVRDDVAEQGAEAWRDIQRQLLQDVFDQGFSGNGTFNGRALNKFLTKTVGEKKARIILGDEMADQLMKVGRVGQDMTYTPAGTIQNFSNTLTAGLDMVENGGGIVGNMLNKLARKGVESNARARVSRAAMADPKLMGGIQKDISKQALEDLMRRDFMGYNLTQGLSPLGAVSSVNSMPSLMDMIFRNNR